MATMSAADLQGTRGNLANGLIETLGGQGVVPDDWTMITGRERTGNS